MTNIYERGLLTHDEVGSFELCRTKWLSTHRGEALTFARSYTTKKGILVVTDMVSSCLKDASISSPYHGQVILNCEEALCVVHKSDRRQAEMPYDYPASGGIDDDEGDGEDVFTNKKIITLEVIITADRKLIGAIFSKLDAELKDEQHAQIKWWYKGDHAETTYKNIYLPPLTTKLLPEFYPTLDRDPKKYLSDYLKSDASILLISGPPGTGKTTLLRHLICDFDLSAHVVYDEALMNTDQVFQNFLFEPVSDILIIEDADTLLCDREHDGNKLMARFLNVTDGLIKLPNKKVVFTTNISDFGRIDPALIRPGRCFDTVHTRPLNHAEAQACAAAAGLGAPTERRDEYTLAELFNNAVGPTQRKIGF